MKKMIEEQKAFHNQYIEEAIEHINKLYLIVPNSLDNMFRKASAIIKHEFPVGTQYLLFGPEEKGGIVEVLVEKSGVTGVFYPTLPDKNYDRMVELLIQTFKDTEAGNAEIETYREYKSGMFAEDFVLSLFLNALQKNGMSPPDSNESRVLH